MPHLAQSRGLLRSVPKLDLNAESVLVGRLRTVPIFSLLMNPPSLVPRNGHALRLMKRLECMASLLEGFQCVSKPVLQKPNGSELKPAGRDSSLIPHPIGDRDATLIASAASSNRPKSRKAFPRSVATVESIL